jgi:hypothetical protein
MRLPRPVIWCWLASVALLPIAGPHVAAGSGTGRDLGDALVTLEEMPDGWHPYQPLPSDRFRLHRGVCGERPRPAPPPADALRVAYALDNGTGPVFGERISRYSTEDAKRVLGKTRALPVPCHWQDAGITWRAEPLRRLHLGHDDVAYLQRKLSGNFPYSYEYVVRRGRIVLAFVLSSERPARALAERLVRRAVNRYEGAQDA